MSSHSERHVEIIEPRREKPGFLPLQSKPQISCAVTPHLISAFVFATRIEHPKFQASSPIL